MPDFATDRIAPSSTETDFFSRVFGWMGLGLAVTGGVAYAIGRDQRALNALFTGKGLVIVIVALVVELALVAGLVGLVQHMSLFEAAAPRLLGLDDEARHHLVGQPPPATGILIFSAYTAYDVQRLKKYEVDGDPSDPAVEKASIVGALALYLDFVNLFLYVLRIFGRRK
ncbi:MAG TPA: Bax inhibitor-1 family protein [Gaiellaceae bacterium]